MTKDREPPVYNNFKVIAEQKMLTLIRDITIIVWLLVGIVPQAQAWYQVQVDNYYEEYYND